MLENTDFIQPNFAKIRVVSSTMNTVTEYHDVPAVTFESFVGSLGGILNLWVGLSFITVIEIVELILNLFSNSEKMKNSKLVNVSGQN